MKPAIKKVRYYFWVAISRMQIMSHKAWLSIKKPRPKTLIGSKRQASIAVIMCTWQRPDFIKMTLEHLDKQRLSKGQSIELYIWNNNPHITKALVKGIKSYTPSSTLVSVKMYNCPVNMGGFGRFYMARAIQSKFPYVIFIDDDEALPTDFVGKAQKMQTPHTIASHWAFKMETGYWERKSVSSKEEANYCGTGGMVLDSRIFLDKELFSCPLKFWFVEDLWLSFFAKHKGWHLKKLAVDISFIDDGKNQYESLSDKKPSFTRISKIDLSNIN